jgi:hypothetical protein
VVLLGPTVRLRGDRRRKASATGPGRSCMFADFGGDHAAWVIEADVIVTLWPELIAVLSMVMSSVPAVLTTKPLMFVVPSELLMMAAAAVPVSLAVTLEELKVVVQTSELTEPAVPSMSQVTRGLEPAVRIIRLPFVKKPCVATMRAYLTARHEKASNRKHVVRHPLNGGVSSVHVTCR